MTDIIDDLRQELAAEREAVAALGRSFDSMRAERDAEREARKALYEAGKAVITFLDTPLNPDTLPDPARAVAMIGNAMTIAAKLP